MIATIGDLHTFKWKVWPINDEGDNGYLALVADFIHQTALHLKNNMNFGPDDHVVFLGDIADAPYKTGNISVDVLVTVKEALQDLVATTGSNVIIISGNHDAVAKTTCLGRASTTWIEILASLPGVQVVSDVPVLNSEENFLCLPYATPKRVEQWLSSGLVLNEETLVMGHFAPRGAVMDNGKAYEDEFTVDVTHTEANKFCLGHAHTPQTLNTAGKLIEVPGVPLPYSWAAKHYGRILLWGTDPKTGNWCVEDAHYTASPSFVGPLSFVDLQAQASSLISSSFVKLLVPADQKGILQQARNAYPTLRIFPVIEPPVNATPAEAARLEALSRCLANTTPEANAAALNEYVQYQADKTASGMNIDVLLSTGRRLMGIDVAAPGEEKASDTVKTTEG